MVRGPLGDLKMYAGDLAVPLEVSHSHFGLEKIGHMLPNNNSALKLAKKMVKY